MYRSHTIYDFRYISRFGFTYVNALGARPLSAFLWNTIYVTATAGFTGQLFTGGNTDYHFRTSSPVAIVTLGDGNNSLHLGASVNDVSVGNGNNRLLLGPLSTVKVGSGHNQVRWSGLENTLVGGDGSNIVSGGDGLATVRLGNGANQVILQGGLNTVVLGNGNNHVSAGTGLVSVLLGQNGYAVRMGTFSVDLPKWMVAGPPGPQGNNIGWFNAGSGNIGVFNAGTGNIGAFNGLGNAYASSGNDNIGVFNGNLNQGANDGNSNTGAFNGNLNGVGALAPNAGNNDGNGNFGSYNGNLNGSFATAPDSGNFNGNNNFGSINGNLNGTGAVNAAELRSPYRVLGTPINGSFNTIVAGNGDNIITSGGYSTVIVGNGHNDIGLWGAGSLVRAGDGGNCIKILPTYNGTYLAGNNTVTTGAGDDTIKVSGWHNLVDAGDGKNLICGGSGFDTFVLPTLGQGMDTIAGFSLSDVLDLRDVLRQHPPSVGDLFSTEIKGASTWLYAQNSPATGKVAVAVLTNVQTNMLDLVAHGSVQFA